MAKYQSREFCCTRTEVFKTGWKTVRQGLPAAEKRKVKIKTKQLNKNKPLGMIMTWNN